jgi:Mn-dependent DtxR family transcriptional regulator
VARAIRELGGKATAQDIASHLKDAPSLVSAKIASLVRSGFVEKCGETLVTVRRFNGEVQVKASVWRVV